MRTRLPRSVLALGLVSLAADVASEMVYPLMPRYLTEVLAVGLISLGLIEGFAETTAAVVKLFAGLLADRMPRRKPLIAVGYGLSGALRPLIALATVWPQVLLLRFFDRVGKGLRGAPRDALIADATPPNLLGSAYGLHRSMDHAGAVIGPLLAAALLLLPGVGLREVFLLAAIPGLTALALVLFAVQEPERRAAAGKPPLSLRALARLPGSLKRLLAALAVFTLGNSTDAFVLLRLGQAGLAPGWLAALWSCHHVFKMAGAWLGGRLTDQLGRRPVVAASWLAYAGVYAALALFDQVTPLVVVFLLYGLFFGLAEPAEKAWVVDLVSPGERGTALGALSAVVGLAALPASLIFGAIWAAFGAPAAFLTGAALALVASVLLLGVPSPPAGLAAVGGARQ